MVNIIEAWRLASKKKIIKHGPSPSTAFLALEATSNSELS